MPGVKFRCPECDALIRRSEVPSGKKVRCPECDVLVRPPQDEVDSPAPRRSGRSRDDDFDDRRRPQRARGTKSGVSPAVIAIPILAAVVLIVGGFVVYALVFAKKDDKNVDNAPAVAARPGVPAVGPRPGPAAAPRQAVGAEVGNLAAEIDAEDLDGKRFKLSDYRGKVVLLDFWGNW